MRISSLLARSSVAAVAVVVAGCRLSDVQDPHAPTTLAAGRASYTQSNRDKVDICHRTNGDSDFILISVASSALDAHLAHHDGRPGDPFPDKPGMRFAANCQPESIPFDITLNWSARALILDTDHNGVGDVIDLNNPLLQVVNGPGQEHRGILEFSIAQFSQPVGHADLTMVLEGGFAQPYPAFVNIYSYSGDGAATLSDFAAGSGSLAAHFECVKPGFGLANGVTSFECLAGTQITRDVTAAVNSRIASHATYAGFNFQVDGGPPAIVTIDAFDNPSSPTTKLRVRTP